VAVKVLPLTSIVADTRSGEIATPEARRLSPAGSLTVPLNVGAEVEGAAGVVEPPQLTTRRTALTRYTALPFPNTAHLVGWIVTLQPRMRSMAPSTEFATCAL
jgi:hypothetical protein